MPTWTQSRQGSLNWSYIPNFSAVESPEVDGAYTCTYSPVFVGTGSAGLSFTTSYIPAGSTITSATLTGTLSFTKTSGVGAFSNSTNPNDYQITVDGQRVTTASFTRDITSNFGSVWGNTLINCSARALAPTLPQKNVTGYTESAPTFYDISDFYGFGSVVLGLPGNTESGTITVKLTLTITYTGAVAQTDYNVHYGTGGAWVDVRPHYGTGGAWVEVKMRFGSGGAWENTT